MSEKLLDELKVCNWKRWDSGQYETSCDNVFEFTNDGTVTVEFGKNQLGANQFMVARLTDYDGEYAEDNCKCAPTLPLAIALFAKQMFGK